MHISNAVLEPAVAGISAVIALGGLSYGLRSLGKSLGERTTVLMGTMAAFIFAAQMVNFPLVVIPASGHLLGGVLAAVVLGPWAGAVVIATVLVVQCLLFGDGGLAALGANFVNMGLIGSVGGYAIYAPIRRAIGGRVGVLVGGMTAAWLSVLLASGAFAIEFAGLSRRDAFLVVLSQMTLVHSVIGVGEAVITGLALRFLLLARPDLIHEPEDLAPASRERSRTNDWLQVGAAGLGLALTIGIFLAPFASERPDGLEHVGASLRILPSPEASAPKWTPLLPDYVVPSLEPTSLKAATAVAGVVGTLVVFATCAALAGAVRGAGLPTEPEGAPSAT